MTESSRCGGCSRAFITYVLFYALEYSKRYVQDHPEHPYICLPFPPKEITQWLNQAAADCTENVLYQESLGGSIFDMKNARTFWKSYKQFYTWWKNNVERKVKFNKIKLLAHSSAKSDKRCPEPHLFVMIVSSHLI